MDIVLTPLLDWDALSQRVGGLDAVVDGRLRLRFCLSLAKPVHVRVLSPCCSAPINKAYQRKGSDWRSLCSTCDGESFYQYGVHDSPTDSQLRHRWFESVVKPHYNLLSAPLQAYELIAYLERLDSQWTALREAEPIPSREWCDGMLHLLADEFGGTV